MAADPTTRVRAILDAAPGPLRLGPAEGQHPDARAIVLSRNLLPAALDVVDAVEDEHHREAPYSGLCNACSRLWPCPTRAALDAYHAKERETLGS